jgi:23S rRNA (cytosine1962-C5)-methyltransferase
VIPLIEIDGDAYRLLHAEADGIPGLVVDRYGDYLVLQVGSAAVEERLDWSVGALSELPSPHGLLLRGDYASRKREGLDAAVRVLYGEAPESVFVREGPVRYRTHLGSGQKTGGFLDQRENHLAAARYARGRVLDVFSYAGGFALHAARRGEEVEAVDSGGSPSKRRASTLN